jgi:MinD-like ATPase involved in chromosome partitioning or flagellar assembly
VTTVVIGSICGSPGATRLAIGLAAAWPGEGRRTLIEADPDGGRLGAELGIGVEPGLMALALAARADRLHADAVIDRGAAAVGDWYVVPSPASSEQAHAALVHASGALADAVGASGEDAWLVDAGRLSPRSPTLALALAADEVLIVTAGSFAALQLVPHRIDALRRAGGRVAVVVVEPTSWSPDEIADFVRADVAAVLPWVRAKDTDLRSMHGAPWRSWWRAVERLAARLADAGRTGATGPDRAPPDPAVALPRVDEVTR